VNKLEENLRLAIRSVPDYPKKGVVFRDLTTLWKDGEMMKRTTDELYKQWRRRNIDKIVGIEARGFIVGAPLADRLGIGFVPARKLGKLPAKRLRMDYELEYGKEGLEMHSDAISKGERVLIVDDLLATGGTSQAAGALVEKLGGKVVGFAFVAELSFLRGREKLAGREVHSLVKYESE
jgi:adenine phosphoribosyltransferase